MNQLRGCITTETLPALWMSIADFSPSSPEADNSIMERRSSRTKLHPALCSDLPKIPTHFRAKEIQFLKYDVKSGTMYQDAYAELTHQEALQFIQYHSKLIQCLTSNIAIARRHGIHALCGVPEDDPVSGRSSGPIESPSKEEQDRTIQYIHDETAESLQHFGGDHEKSHVHDDSDPTSSPGVRAITAELLKKAKEYDYRSDTVPSREIECSEDARKELFLLAQNHSSVSECLLAGGTRKTFGLPSYDDFRCARNSFSHSLLNGHYTRGELFGYVFEAVGIYEPFLHCLEQTYAMVVAQLRNESIWFDPYVDDNQFEEQEQPRNDLDEEVAKPVKSRWGEKMIKMKAGVDKVTHSDPRTPRRSRIARYIKTTPDKIYSHSKIVRKVSDWMLERHNTIRAQYEAGNEAVWEESAMDGGWEEP